METLALDEKTNVKITHDGTDNDFFGDEKLYLNPENDTSDNFYIVVENDGGSLEFKSINTDDVVVNVDNRTDATLFKFKKIYWWW